jgi:hypothetical protein
MSQQHCLFDVLVNSSELHENLRISTRQQFQQASLAGHMGEYQPLFMLNNATLSIAKQKFTITSLMLW